MENFEIIKFTNESMAIDVNVSPNGETVWLTKEQMGILFDRDRSVISRHIKNIFDEGEIDKGTSVHFLHISSETNPSHRPPELYNLDVIISVGYRVKSKNGIVFRKWATNILKNYLLKGYAISNERILAINENYINLVNDVISLKNDVTDIKKIINKEYPKESIFYEDKVFDAYVFLNNLLKSAKESILVIDGYLDDSIFHYLVGIPKNTKVTFACAKPQRLSEFQLGLFKKQNNAVEMIEAKNFHDRFICVDSVVYHLGSSFNSFANKTTTIIKMESITVEDLLNAIN
ncbi:MAG: virulence RhuM family protein [Bacilli bacterium]|nr:virulence RhuM family protein [Bacilli bacterium]